MFTGPQYTLTLRGNVRLPQTTPTEADTCQEPAVPRLQAAGSEDEPHSDAELRRLTIAQILTVGLDELCTSSLKTLHSPNR
jgi:hypothetical protein